MLHSVRTHRLLSVGVLLITLLLGSGYMGILALCCDLDGPPHVEAISFGCCHCAEHGEPTGPGHPHIDSQHEHCTDVEISISYIGHSSTIDVANESLCQDHPNPVMSWLEDCSGADILLRLDDEGPPVSPPRQVSATVSSTVLLC